VSRWKCAILGTGMVVVSAEWAAAGRRLFWITLISASVQA
jgi:hypothetical protein